MGFQIQENNEILEQEQEMMVDQLFVKFNLDGIVQQLQDKLNQDDGKLSVEMDILMQDKFEMMEKILLVMEQQQDDVIEIQFIEDGFEVFQELVLMLVEMVLLRIIHFQLMLKIIHNFEIKDQHHILQDEIDLDKYNQNGNVLLLILLEI